MPPRNCCDFHDGHLIASWTSAPTSLALVRWLEVGKTVCQRNINNRVLPHTFSRSRMVLLPKRKSWVPRSNVSADHAYEVASRFEGLFSVVPRNESGVVIERHVPLSPEAIEDQSASHRVSCQCGP